MDELLVKAIMADRYRKAEASRAAPTRSLRRIGGVAQTGFSDCFLERLPGSCGRRLAGTDGSV